MLRKWMKIISKIFCNLLQKANMWGEKKQEETDKILKGYGIDIK